MPRLIEKFGRKKEAAVLALLSSRSVEDAARVAGVNARTLYRSQKEPEFDAAYRKLRRAAFAQTTARLQQGSSAAATILMKSILDQNTPVSTRVRAAELIVNHAAKAIEIEDIEARVAQLERATEAKQ